MKRLTATMAALVLAVSMQTASADFDATAPSRAGQAYTMEYGSLVRKIVYGLYVLGKRNPRVIVRPHTRKWPGT